MYGKSCFGRLFSETARECRELCQVGKECQAIMGNQETISSAQIALPCFKTYDERNYACHTACRDRERCKEATMTVDALPSTEAPPESEEIAAQQPVEAELLDTVLTPPISELTPQEVTPGEEDSKGEEVQETKPVKTPVRTPVRTATSPKPTKKGLVRDLVGSGNKYSADDLIQATIDGGFVADTDAARKKARSYIHMCLSEFKKKPGWDIQKDDEGRYYVEVDRSSTEDTPEEV